MLGVLAILVRVWSFCAILWYNPFVFGGSFSATFLKLLCVFRFFAKLPYQIL